ncbi:uncharacterized protein IL334_001125 [Kwoniella shivajii]|uniref:F-box domain-containing protein n=1 Tax=Kwoniella shivajii TaxID=564305 RepID=A0ABZ1CR26_9TREE|nr:hypothetical protein IL334_001125 [Kwoniella shivajii]
MSKNKKLQGDESITNRPMVEQSIRHGKRALQEKDWDGAREQFDKAISLGGKRNIRLLDYKLRALIELPHWHRTANEITKIMIATDPEDYRGYYRHAKLLHKMGGIEAALNSINQAIKVGPTKSQDERIYKALQWYRSDLIFVQHENEQRRAAQSQVERNRIEAARIVAKKAKINFINRLSPDVLINIAEAGLIDDPGFVVKMAGVCRNWRNILLNTGSLWSTLILGKKRVVERAKFYLERNKGNIKELIVKEEFEMYRFPIITGLLSPYLSKVRRLTILQSSVLLQHDWKKKFCHLEYLRIKSDILGIGTDLVYRLLSPDAASLLELDIEGGGYGHIYSRYDEKAEGVLNNNSEEEEDPPFWTENSSVHLNRLRVLRLKRCFIYAAWPDHTELLSHLPSIEIFEMNNVVWNSIDTMNDPLARQWYDRRSARGLDMTLQDLNTYKITGSAKNLALYNIKAPRLQHLDIWSAHASGSASIAPHILTPGLAAALPNLLSLDIGRCTIDHRDMLDILPKLKSLKFLNVSYCPLDNAFLEALERKGNEKDLLPNLMALSIAGNTEITSAPLRRFVLSRTPGGLKPPKPSPVPKKGSAFRPSVPKPSPFAPSTSHSQSSHQSTKVNLTQPPNPTANSSKPEVTLPSIQWLCLDNCDRVEFEIVDYLRRKVRYISQQFSTNIVENRIRGKGKYSWEGEYDIGCGTGESGCQLRKLPGSKDGYYVHHTCKQAMPDDQDERGWSLTQSSQTQSQTPGQITQLRYTYSGPWQ